MLVLSQDFIQDAVGNLVRQFIGMSFRDRFRRKEEISSSHFTYSLFANIH